MALIAPDGTLTAEGKQVMVKELLNIGKGTPRIEKMRVIVSAHSAKKIDGVRIDVTTAGAYVAVWDALGDGPRRTKFDNVPLVKALDFVWKVVTAK
jgi:hypothetical protein